MNKNYCNITLASVDEKMIFVEGWRKGRDKARGGDISYRP